MDLIDILRRQLEGSMGGAPAQQQPRSTGLENIEAESRRLERELGVDRTLPQAQRQAQPQRQSQGQPQRQPQAQPQRQPQPQPQPQASPDDVLAEMFDMIRNKGGVGGVADEFRKHGMNDEADSWVGTGQNRPVNPRQVEQVFPEEIRRMAEKFGIPPEKLAEALSKTLPQVIDHSTPQGRVEPQSGNVVDQATDFLRRNAGKVI